MANATLTMNVDELADVIAAKVSKVDPAEHEAVTAERDKLRGELDKIGYQAMPARFYDEHGATFEAARAFFEHYIEESSSAGVKLEAVTGERDEARETLRRIVHGAVPSQWANYDDPFGSARKVFDGWLARGNALKAASRELRDAVDAKVLADRDVATLRQSVSTLSDQAIELRGDLKTACDERDEFRRQLDEAQAKLSGSDVLAKDAVMVHEGTDPYGVLSAGEVVTVVHGKVDPDGDVKVRREGSPMFDYEFARVSNLKPRKRTYKAGDPEPADKSVTLTGEDDRGRKVTLRYGRYSKFSDDGGALTWWDVTDEKWPVHALSGGGFAYWAERFGPLTEV
ncbi:hypothetical protein BH760_gp56 [Gordonia phage Splinter]|uniref:Uncharacterized protein n=2 Tax=Vendettavirus vendetta TaxID=2049886 RepID=A0A160DD58_9CAUD|nr:hypothetical protein BH795_gp56 [Gordonia phage Vendetta]YP_009275409.1 hypothetical protein BH760_gp56 [Gordonia phage Splinter]ANA85602.1 hypothetical protein PBI_VENDETTA_55 [Gordonia phage Vendetta]ANA85681.1 hypothetical protein PBI_SPLINTER_55 [Gordonia phage Splinter]